MQQLQLTEAQAATLVARLNDASQGMVVWLGDAAGD